jgi:hypothetical protein
MMARVERLRTIHRHLRLVPPVRSATGNLPLTRGDCEGGPRPCPLISCRHHLGVDVTFAGGLRLYFRDGPEELAESCALDVADRGGHSLLEVAAILGVSGERIRQIEEHATKKLLPLVEQI